MNIENNGVVALTWSLKDTLGEVLDVLDEPVEFLVGGDDLFEVIETALIGKAVGDTVNVRIEPEQGFGEFNDQLIFLESRDVFPAALEEGMTIEGVALPAGCSPHMPQDVLYTVTDIYPEHVVLDGNHPLAGIALNLTLQIRAVRAATEAELACRSAGTGFFKVSPLQIAPGSQLLQ